MAFLLDGHDNNSQQISTGHSGQKEVVKPSVDAIQEFKVVTNSYSAEYGRSSSGVVSVSLKSGTNQLHGTVYEFFRDDALDAKNYFATTKPPLPRAISSAARSAFPLVRNRTFFFGDVERGRHSARQHHGHRLCRRSPTARSVLASTMRDPLTRLPFPGNEIPASRVDPVAARILGYVPLPQTAAA